MADLAATSELAGAFGASEEGVEVTLEWRPLEGPDRRATLRKRVVTIPSVPLTKLYEVDGRKVGYIVFRNFVEPSVAALDASFTALRDAGATELVLDLRYNGGGLVSVAQHLASLIGGQRTTGQVLAEYVHNDRHRELNRQLRFEAKPNALALNRLVVITTRASASASELIVNGLRPYLPVIVIGDRTYGKPVGQYGLPFCDTVLHAVSFVLRNAQGEADYFEGLPATCTAGDALERQLGDVEEASLSEAFVYLRTGACTPPVVEQPGQAAARRGRSAVQPTDGGSSLLGAREPTRDRAPRESGRSSGGATHNTDPRVRRRSGHPGRRRGGGRPFLERGGLGAGRRRPRHIPRRDPARRRRHPAGRAGDAPVGTDVARAGHRRPGTRGGSRTRPNVDHDGISATDPRRDHRPRQSAPLRRRRQAAGAAGQRGRLRRRGGRSPAARVVRRSAAAGRRGAAAPGAGDGGRYARAEGWTVLAQDLGFGNLGRLEATDSTFLFGRIDDIVVRVIPHPAGSRVDVRSSAATTTRRRWAQRRPHPRFLAFLAERAAAEPAGTPAP